MESKKIRIAIVGYGNIGKFSVDAVNAAPDMELVGVVRRPESLGGKKAPELLEVPVVGSIDELEQVDVAVLCGPTRAVPKQAEEILAKGINTVDSYDIHGELVNVRRDLMKVAKKNNTVSILSAGWDPGTDSMIRTMFEFMAPRGITYTNFGPGMSMGHSVAVKSVEGVKDALSVTIPAGEGLHKRMVYLEIEEGVEFETVKATILKDPYFSNDDSQIFHVSDVNALIDKGHGVLMERKGVSGATHNQIFKFEQRINNPALTSQVLIASARATMKQSPGAYTMVEVPIIDYVYGDKEQLLYDLI